MTPHQTIAHHCQRVIVALLLLACGVSMGCEENPSLPADPAPSANVEDQEVSALQRLQAAGSAGDWETAWTYSSEVMIHAGDDQTALLSVAEVAFRTGREVMAAELLAEAAKVDGYRELALVNRGVLGLVNVGRLFEAIELLEQAVKTHPEDVDTRRVLFDLYVTTEQRRAANDEAKTLIRRRAFDFQLLTHSMIDFRRSLANESLKQMIHWNPDDPRALIGDARTQLDLSEFRLCIKQCDKILDIHPDFRPAVDLRFAAASALNDPEVTRSLLGELAIAPPGSIAWSGWVLLGDFFASQQDRQSAAACYWKAAAQATDRPQVWTKLASVTDRPDVARRARQLIELRQSEIEVGRTFRGEADAKMMQTFDDIAQARFAMGQPWLAEAWAAFALTVPIERGVDATEYRDDLASTRKRIVGTLNQQTPWVLPSSILVPRDPVSKTLTAASLLASATKRLPDQDAPGEGLPNAPNMQPPKPFVAKLIDEAKQRGLIYDEHSAKNLDRPGVMFYATLGCGGGTVDFDQDGWPDLYLVGAGGRPPQRDSASNALFRNVGGRFVDVTEPSETIESDFGQGVTVGDLNQDGFEDLVCLNYGRDTCWINNGDGTFTNQTARWIPSIDDGWSTSGAIADFNGDFIPDLLSLRYCDGLDPVRVACVDQSEPNQAHGGQADRSSDPNDITGHRACSPMVFKPAADQIYFGSPSGQLVALPTNDGLALPQYGRGLGLMVGPLDDQPGLDAFVANDMSANHLWSYQKASPTASRETSPHDGTSPQEGTWNESGLWRGVAGNGLSSPQGSMGVAAGDFDRDGGIDLYVTNFSAEYNTLHHKRGNVWDDQTAAKGLIVPTLSQTGFGTDASDLNRDGWPDLIVSNGHVDNFRTDEDDAGFMFQPLQIFAAANRGRMEPVPAHPRAKYLNSDHIGRALWTIDADRDHQVDFVITHQSEPVALLMNRIDPDKAFVEIELVGTRCERSAAGAIVEVRRGEWFTRETLMVGDGYLCRNEPVLRFAVPAMKQGGSKDSDERVWVDVHWPDGTQTLNQPVEINRRHKLIQPRDVTEDRSAAH